MDFDRIDKKLTRCLKVGKAMNHNLKGRTHLVVNKKEKLMHVFFKDRKIFEVDQETGDWTMWINGSLILTLARRLNACLLAMEDLPCLKISRENLEVWLEDGPRRLELQMDGKLTREEFYRLFLKKSLEPVEKRPETKSGSIERPPTSNRIVNRLLKK